jgi:transposase
MGGSCSIRALIPSGILLESVEEVDAIMVSTVRPSVSAADCPACGETSHRVHSRYRRSLADLPLSGRPVRLTLLVQRFRCDRGLCSCRIFTERLATAAPWARRTARLDEIVHHLGLALWRPSSRELCPAAPLARQQRHSAPGCTLAGGTGVQTAKAIGIDDWAWKRNHRYGMLICDLERRRTTALLPDREPATAQAWLSSQPQIEIMTCDRGGAYALAAARALPRAMQVADHWHPAKPFLPRPSHACVRCVPPSVPQRSISYC